MKIALMVEGKTEKLGLPAFLRRCIETKVGSVGLKPVLLAGTPDYDKGLARTAQRLLDSKNVTGAVCLLDLYGCQLPFPADLTVEKKYKWGKQYLESKVGSNRFRQHFAVHEIEAWLLSQPELFPHEVQERLPSKPPEEIDFDNPPSRVLKTAYRQALKNRSYRKTWGAALFTKLDPGRASAACPYLRLLLDDLQTLASGAA